MSADDMADMRYPILRLIKQREDAGRPGPTVGEVAEGLSASPAKVWNSVRASEGAALVSIHRYMGTDYTHFTVFLKPRAHLYLERRAGAD